MERRRVISVVLVVLVVLSLCSCGGSKVKYPITYSMTSKTMDEIVDLLIEEQGLSESDLAAVGGRSAFSSYMTLMLSWYGLADISIKLVDSNTAIMTSEGSSISSSYVIKDSALILSDYSGTIAVGTISKDMKKLTLDEDLFGGYSINLYAE